MDENYFAEFKTGVKNAWKVELGNWVLFNGLQPAVLQGPIPTSPFRVAITISATTGHTSLVGSISVNSEVLDFSKATRLTIEEELTALPSIEITGLDCNVLVECISTGGEPLQKETLKPIEIVCFPRTRIMKDPSSSSGWMQTDYDVNTEEPLSIGDQIRYPDPHQGDRTIDIYVRNVSSAVDLEYGNTQPFRVLNCA